MVIKIGDTPWNKGLIGEEYLKHYKNGNPRKGRTYEELYGLKKAQEIKEIVSKTHKGIHKPQKDSMRKKISETRRRLFAEGKLKPSFFGKKHSEETKALMRKTKISVDRKLQLGFKLIFDRKPCLCGCGKYPKFFYGYMGTYLPGHNCYNRLCTPKTRAKMRESQLGKKHTEETKKKLGEIIRLQYKNGERIHPQLGKHPSRETIRKVLKRRNMSTIEIKFNKIINQNNLPYRFVGNGDFLIERKNPDFINTNGQKIAIEVYWRKHKEVFRNGLKAWQEERQKIFNKYGWTILFFDEVDVDYKVDKIIHELQGKEN